MYPVAIIAGGKATRLYPVTHDIPKSMIKISSKPFIHWQLKMLSQSGIKEVILCLGVNSQLIIDYVGDGSQYDLEVKYSVDGDAPLGTGGAIVKALPFLGKDFGVVYGDSYLPINYEEIMLHYKSQKCLALMTILENSNKYDKSNVEYKNQKIIQYSKKNQNSKMNHIDFGFSIFNKKIFDKAPMGVTIDLQEIIGNVVKSGELLGYEVTQRFYEIGSFKGIEDFKKYMEDK